MTPYHFHPWVPYVNFVLAFVLMLFIGSPMIRSLKMMKGAKWAPREDTPDSHLQKVGVPSMGGLGIVGAALASWLLVNIGLFGIAYRYNDLDSRDLNTSFLAGVVLLLLLPLIVLGHAILGYIDDLLKARSKGGITSKQKLFGQCLLAVTFLILYSWSPLRFGLVPFIDYTRTLFDDLWIWSVCLLVIIGTSNAVNLTDGIDGLAAGLSVQIAIAFLIVRFQPGSEYDGNLVMVWMCLGGACLGFLAFNKNPAKVFMGDTGSLALGAALGAGAIVTKTVFLLPFIGFIFFVEMFSVMSQVAYFKYTKKKFGEGKRIFRRAPLHHHFELSGWREWKVVGTFWAVNAVTTALGLFLWNTGRLPKFPF